jgi:hypothetical protein
VIEQEAERRSELAREGEAALDPGAFLPQHLPDRHERQAVIVGQRGGDVGLIHGSDGAGRGV